jgi:predicted phosphate transport protein (TIGR00153 family)
MGLFPKEIDFFEMFDKASLNIINASGLVVELFRNFDNFEERAKNIYELEQEGDLLTHEIMRQLNKTFLTPIDREDIHSLGSRLDDILDLIWGAADRVHIFKIKVLLDDSIDLAESLQRNVETIHKAIHSLRLKKYSYVQEQCIEINRLENEADRIFRTAIVKLFDNEKDPVEIIKWKEILEILEMATDKCEDVANILEAIVLKHG